MDSKVNMVIDNQEMKTNEFQEEHERMLFLKNCANTFDWEKLRNKLLSSNTDDVYQKLASLKIPLRESIESCLFEFMRFMVLKALKRDIESKILIPSCYVNWVWKNCILLPEEYTKLCKELLPRNKVSCTYKYVSQYHPLKYRDTLKFYEKVFETTPSETYWPSSLETLKISSPNNMIGIISDGSFATKISPTTLRKFSINDIEELLLQEGVAGAGDSSRQKFLRGRQCLEALVSMLSEHFRRKDIKRKLSSDDFEERKVSFFDSPSKKVRFTEVDLNIQSSET